MVIVVGSACGSPHAAGAPPSAATASASASPTLSPDDQQLLTELRTVDFQMYETPIRIGAYVFSGAGLNYDRNTLQVEYGGMAIDEWKALNFDPSSGKCSTQDPQYSWNCKFLASSPQGHTLYASPSGGLNGYPADLGDIYVELGSTVINMKRSGLHTPSLADLMMFADTLAKVAADAVVRLNIGARAYAQHLRDTVTSRIDFKTNLPQKPLQDFTLDKKFLLNPTDPLHPYLYLHFSRVAVGNEASEFTAAEFRDGYALSASHCGVLDPEFYTPDTNCKLTFMTSRGIAVYTDYSTTRFDLGPTRVTLFYSVQIDKVTSAELSTFIDSFVEVPPTQIPAG
jgi:hypothetical protein